MARTAKSVNISLPPALYSFLQDTVDEGEYPSASAVMQDALRLLQREKEAYLARGVFVREALGGPAERFRKGERGQSFEAFKAERRRRWKESLASQIAELQEAMDDTA